jgi:hypothetical protein
MQMLLVEYIRIHKHQLSCLYPQRKTHLNSKIKKNIFIFLPLSELDHVQKIGKQLNILERISNTTDPWEDINLFKYIKSSYHENILSGRKIRRIEFIAKRYLFSDDTLLYRCHFDI